MDRFDRIPCGTQLQCETNELITDLVEDADEYIIKKGGRAEGNGEFATPTNQASLQRTGIRGKENDILLC